MPATPMPTTEPSTVTVRYFAGARAAVGVDQESVPLPAGSSVSALLVELGRRHPPLLPILERCSYLADALAVRDVDAPLPSGATVDVLPPFAGG